MIKNNESTKRTWSGTETTGQIDMQLQSRVTSLEVNVTALTNTVHDISSDVKDLANITRQQGLSTEKQIQDLLVAVTTAKAPKATNWTAILSVGLSFLGIAIVIMGLILAPIFRDISRTNNLVYEKYQQTADNQKDLKEELEKSQTIMQVEISRIKDWERDKSFEEIQTEKAQVNALQGQTSKKP